MKIKIINNSNNNIPCFETPGSAGMDIRAFITEPIIIKPLERTLIPTGLFIELPLGYEAQIRPRSGLALKSGITVLNTPGTIDADYRGELKILLINLSSENFEVNSGDRIAQMVIAKHETPEFIEVDILSETTRGVNGYGHSGIK